MLIGNRRDYVAPRRLAAAAFVIGLLLWAIVALIQYRGEHARQRDDATQHYANYSFEQRPAACAHVARFGVYSCAVNVSQAEPDASEARRSEYDLQAQQEMAEWAFVMMLATIAGVITTVIGLVYVVRAYLINAKATQYASRAAYAAIRANRQARDQAIVQLRPYVILGEIKILRLINLVEKAVLGVRIVFVWQNTGASPTRKLLLHTLTAFIVDPPFDLEAALRTEPTLSDEEDTGYRVIGPNGTLNSGAVELSMDQIDAIIAGALGCYIMAWVEYDDGFEGTPRRRTEVCVRLDFEKRPLFEEPAVSVIPRHVTGFNGIDEDCYRQPAPRKDRRERPNRENTPAPPNEN